MRRGGTVIGRQGVGDRDRAVGRREIDTLTGLRRRGRRERGAQGGDQGRGEGEIFSSPASIRFQDAKVVRVANSATAHRQHLAQRRLVRQQRKENVVAPLAR